MPKWITTSESIALNVRGSVALHAVGGSPSGGHRKRGAQCRNAGRPPLAVMDETSMALSLSVKKQTEQDLAALGKTMPSHPGWAVISRMAEGLNRPGRAGGGGFYEYRKNKPKHLWSGLTQEFGKADVDFSLEDLRDRILYIQAIEAIRIMEEGVIETTRDANIGSILGIGFPRWTGGVIQFVNMTGTRRCAERAAELAKRFGERFSPPPLLVHKAERNERFE